MAGLGARPETPLAQRAEELGEVGLAELEERHPPGLGEGHELAEVPLVGRERGVGQAPLDAQVVEPCLRGLGGGHVRRTSRSRTMRQRTSASPTRSARVRRA